MRTDGEIARSKESSCVLLKKGNYCQLDTYFNSMSTGKWKKYTNVENLLVDVSIKGRGVIRVCFLERVDIKQVLWESEWSGNGELKELPDVYKRQLFTQEKNQKRMLWYFGNMVLSSFALIMGTSDNAYPVSYTHLGVYKRQPAE